MRISQFFRPVDYLIRLYKTSNLKSIAALSIHPPNRYSTCIIYYEHCISKILVVQDDIISLQPSTIYNTVSTPTPPVNYNESAIHPWYYTNHSNPQSNLPHKEQMTAEHIDTMNHFLPTAASFAIEIEAFQRGMSPQEGILPFSKEVQIRLQSNGFLLWQWMVADVLAAILVAGVLLWFWCLVGYPYRCNFLLMRFLFAFLFLW